MCVLQLFLSWWVVISSIMGFVNQAFLYDIMLYDIMF